MKLSYHKLLMAGVILLAVGLRSYKLTQIPLGLHGDEVGAGYNAYSLFKAGVDEYQRSWPLSFRENISPLNFYAMIPFVAILGPIDLAVRLPGVVWGLGTIIVVYLLVKRLFPKQKWLAEVTSLLVVISPWHVSLSRIAHDAGLGLLVQLLAVWLFLRGSSLSWWLLGLSLYAYHGPKVTTPLLLIALLLTYRKKFTLSKLRWGLTLLGIMSLPLAISMATTPLADNRLVGVSILVREVTLKPALEQAENLPAMWRLVFYNPVAIYSLAFLRQYFNYLNWDWLFFDNSLSRYFNLSRVGLVYLVELPFLLIGIYELVRVKEKAAKLVLAGLIIGPVAGAVTLGEPNVGRAILMLPMLELITAWGMITTVNKWPIKPWVVGGALVVNLIWFGQQYFIQAPREFAIQWAYGSKQAAELAAKYEQGVDRIIFTDRYKQPYIFVLWYAHPQPEWLAGQVSRHRRHGLGYDAIGKYEFRPINWQEDKTIANTLLVGTAEEIPEKAEGIVNEISDLRGQVLWRIVFQRP